MPENDNKNRCVCMYKSGASCRGGRFLNDVFGRHEQRVDVLEAVELALVDLSDEAPEMVITS